MWVLFPGAQDVDLSEVVANPAHVLLVVEGGAILFLQDEIGSGIYGVHTQFLDNYRGRYAIQASLAAYRWMFTHTDCMRLQTLIPVHNKAAMLAAKIVGFKCQFERQNVWPISENQTAAARFYKMSYDDWLGIAKADLTQSGEEFHARFEQERARLGMTGERNHPDEPVHDLHAGACAETIYGGQPEKAVVLYNRWARFAQYQPIALVARSPLVLDIVEAVLLIQDRTFKVVKCRS